MTIIKFNIEDASSYHLPSSKQPTRPHNIIPKLLNHPHFKYIIYPKCISYVYIYIFIYLELAALYFFLFGDWNVTRPTAFPQGWNLSQVVNTLLFPPQWKYSGCLRNTPMCHRLTRRELLAGVGWSCLLANMLDWCWLTFCSWVSVFRR